MVFRAIGLFKTVVGGFVPGKFSYGARIAAWMGWRRSDIPLTNFAVDRYPSGTDVALGRSWVPEEKWSGR